ncbi:MAG TPA: carbohydrate kinase [Erysipelotrichaceae bacterium]|nr:carbohydrate kinase [Erysipelotrichaceae bacterium]
MRRIYALGEYIIDFLNDGVCSFKAQPGGAPANVAVCVSLLGGESSLITTLGDDIFKDFLLNVLKETGVDTTHVSLINKKNMLAFVNLNEENDRIFDFYQTDTANQYLNLECVSKIDFKNDILHFCTVSLKNENNVKTHLEAINLVKKNRGIISFDPNLRFNLWEDFRRLKDISLKFIRYANIIKLSKEELLFLTAAKNERDAVQTIWHDELTIVFVTKGKDGVSIYTKDRYSTVIGKKVSVLDTTGAGDAFIGSVLYQIQTTNVELSEISFEKWIEITNFANEKAALSTTANGAISAYRKVF